MVSMLNWKKLSAVAITTFALGCGAAMAETKLVLSSWLPPKHPLVVGAIKPWAKQIKEATEGRVTVRVLAKPLGAPPAHFDMAVENIADITYGLHSFTKDDRFLRSRIGQFTGLGDSAESVSTAYWDVYANQLGAQKEHEGVKLLGLFSHGPGMLFTTKTEAKTKDDLQGLKIRTPGGHIADLASGLGITTQFMSSGEVYEKLSRGVIDGGTMAQDALYAFKLAKHAKFAMRVPGGLYNTSWFLVMNKAKWDSIDKKDQEAILAVSGASFAALAGKAWDAADKKGADYADKQNMTTYTVSDTLLGDIKSLSSDLEKKWADAVSKDGYDGLAALQAIRTRNNVK